MTEKIQRIRARKENLDLKDISRNIRHADEYLNQLESGRDLSQIVVHIDCDAFFAAVEELDRPELRDVPMAVGKGVLTTCNYHARRFGCRSGMASFIAQKLCPDLICLPQNYEKYSAKAEEIRRILIEYDPLFQSASIDEAYLNITGYCAENMMDPQEAVQRLRERILEETKVTVSAGIAANARIAKIASNWNKPNGQYIVPSERSAIMSFMSTIPVRKINGVGRVFERELEAVGIKTCGDIYPHRGILSELFGQKAFQFLAHCYLGLGRTRIHPVESHERKSVSTESTFKEIGDIHEMQKKLRWTAEELEGDLKKSQVKGRTLTLKVKLHTFEILSRQVAPRKAVYLADDLYNHALPILAKLQKEIPGMKLRLIGLRCSNLLSTKKFDPNFFGSSRRPERFDCPPAASIDDADSRLETCYGELEHGDSLNMNGHLNCATVTEAVPERDTEADSGTQTKPNSQDLFESWDCPVCLRPQKPDNASFNHHIDNCLSKNMIKEVVKGSLKDPQASSTFSLGKRKSPFHAPVTIPKRLFFG